MKTPMEKAIDAVRGALHGNPCVLLDGRTNQHYWFSDRDLQNALVKGMRMLTANCVCRWPDGTLREVVTINQTKDTAHIIWNERHAPMGEQGCVAGMSDEVPLSWLFVSANDSTVPTRRAAQNEQ